MSSFWLEYVKDGEQRQFSFDASTVSIGRDKASDFVLDHPTVSRQHARIVFGQRGPQLVVLSRGGLTAIDGTQVSGEVELFDGSEIHFGQLAFTFRSNQAPRRPQNGADGWSQSQQMGAAPTASANWQQPASPSASWNPAGSQPQVQQPAQQQALGQPMGSQQFGSQQPAAPQPSPRSSGIDWGDGEAAASGAQSWSPGGWDTAGAGAAESEPDLVSWDDIANSADDEESYAQQGITDFEKMQQARARLEKQSKGTNPILVGGAGLLIVGLIVWIMFGGKGPEGTTTQVTEKDFNERPVITYVQGDIDCVGRAACEKAAIDSYRVGVKTWEQRDADIVNMYESYRLLDMASKFLEKGEVTPLPAELGDLEARKDEIKQIMDAKFQGYRVTFHDHKKTKRYRQMADTLTRINAYFPDKRSKYNEWASQRELEMKNQGVFPATPRY